MLKKILAVAALCSVSSAFAATNIVVDGSFESASAGSLGFATYPSIAGWTSTGGGIEVRDNVVGTAEDGVNFVELDSTQNSSMSQTLTTVVGQTYALSFYYSNRAVSPYNGQLPGGVVPVSSDGLSVSYGEGVVTVGVLPTNSTHDNVWTLYTTEFTATSTSTVLTFAALGTSDSFGTSLDNVSVTAVPEPAQLAMMGAGLLVVAGLARRRNRQG